MTVETVMYWEKMGVIPNKSLDYICVHQDTVDYLNKAGYEVKLEHELTFYQLLLSAL